MILSRNDINNLDKISRLNLINSITGYKPANLIGTKSLSGDTNLAIFSGKIKNLNSLDLEGQVIEKVKACYFFHVQKYLIN